MSQLRARKGGCVMRIVGRRMLSTIVFVVSLVFFIRVMLGVRLVPPSSPLRRFNKHILNPVALWVAAHRKVYYGVLHHTGRRSGTSYTTPVVAKVTSRGIIIPLPYGEGSDWCRNVLAAGVCSLTMNGAEYALHSPEVVPASIAEPLLPLANVQVWRRVGIQSYLLLQVRSRAETPAIELAPKSLAA